MLKNIKSIFFIKQLFSYLKEKEKLDIIKYNKSLQNIFNINIFNYKVFSEKYVIYYSNGGGKEYSNYDNNIIFEGEYKNKKRNGKGKEYLNGNIVFIGEYINGKRNGKGKEYKWKRIF